MRKGWNPSSPYLGTERALAHPVPSLFGFIRSDQHNRQAPTHWAFCTSVLSCTTLLRRRASISKVLSTGEFPKSAQGRPAAARLALSCLDSSRVIRHPPTIYSSPTHTDESPVTQPFPALSLTKHPDRRRPKTCLTTSTTDRDHSSDSTSASQRPPELPSGLSQDDRKSTRAKVPRPPAGAHHSTRLSTAPGRCRPWKG